LLLLDGSDFRVVMGYLKPFLSYKFKKSGLGYVVGLCILMGDICWWSGPYAPSSGLTYQLSGTLWYQCWSLGSGLRRIGATKAPPQPTSNAQVFWRQTQTLWKFSNGYGVGRRPSTRASRVGQFLSTPYHHDLLEHRTVFGAIVVLTQLSFVANPLFTVAY
jgi:hypothetical protein